MTIKESETFYQKDDKRYELKENKNFLNWLNCQIKNGYKPPVTINDLQKLINDIALWYELKYPNREFDLANGRMNHRFINFTNEMKNLNIEELFYRLSNNELAVLACNYRGNRYSFVDDNPHVGINIFSKMETDGLLLRPQAFLIYIDALSGKVVAGDDIVAYYNDKKIEYIDDNKDMDIDELYSSLIKYQDDLDLHELEECMQNNKGDILLRKYLLRLIPLKLIYSRNTIPEYGYLRAKKFIDEFNTYYLSKNVNLELFVDEMDIIMNQRHKTLVK